MILFVLKMLSTKGHPGSFVTIFMRCFRCDWWFCTYKHKPKTALVPTPCHWNSKVPFMYWFVGKPYIHNMRPLCAKWPLRLCGSVFELSNNLRSWNILILRYHTLSVLQLYYSSEKEKSTWCLYSPTQSVALERDTVTWHSKAAVMQQWEMDPEMGFIWASMIEHSKMKMHIYM